MDAENKEVIQKTIDRLLYCGDKFKEELKLLLDHYDPHKERKYSSEPKEWRYPLDESI